MYCHRVPCHHENAGPEEQIELYLTFESLIINLSVGKVQNMHQAIRHRSLYDTMTKSQLPRHALP